MRGGAQMAMVKILKKLQNIHEEHQVIKNFKHNLNVVLRFGNFKIFGHQSPKSCRNFRKIEKTHVAYQTEF